MCLTFSRFAHTASGATNVPAVTAQLRSTTQAIRIEPASRG
jgi:hypothetical protein